MVLDLSHNSIKILEYTWFIGLSSLIEIRLNTNMITSLDSFKLHRLEMDLQNILLACFFPILLAKRECRHVRLGMSDLVDCVT